MMKENPYDNEKFFEKYSQMDRSTKGLQGAGEWQTLKQLLPDFAGKRVLDLGCGYGWHCLYAADQGAKEVLGVDLSEKMLAVAQEKCRVENVRFLHSAIEDVDFAENQFDIVLSSLAFHYLESFNEVAKKVHSYLKNNGSFVFSVEHPLFTAYGTQDWIYTSNGEIDHFPVDNYFYEGERKATFLGEEVIKYHRTLTTYVHDLVQNGFLIKDIIEPMPPKDMLDVPGMKDEMRRPMMLLIAAENRK